MFADIKMQHDFLPTACISKLNLVAETGNVNYARFITNSHIMVLTILDEEYTANILPPAARASTYTREFDLETHFGVSGCVQRSDISQVRIEAGGNDGWNVASVRTTISDTTGTSTELTNNPGLDVWIDGDEPQYFSYNATKLVLTLPTGCIKDLTVIALTDVTTDARSISPHKLVLQLKDRVLEVPLTEIDPTYSIYDKFVTMADINAATLCVQKGDIKQVRIEEGGNDAWHIKEIDVTADAGDGVIQLAINIPFNQWVDGNQEYLYINNAKKLILTLA